MKDTVIKITENDIDLIMQGHKAVFKMPEGNNIFLELKKE